MQNAIRRKYAFVLPLPLNNPSTKAAIYGLTYFIADENLNPVGKREIITCRGLENLLPSPNYLFSLGIDPFSIKRGLTEERFLDEITEKIFNEETTVITWSIRNLRILEQICIRNLRKPDILKKAYTVCDINRVLKLHETLETGYPFNSDALSACAAKYGFKNKIQKGAHLERLDLLLYLFRYLSQVNPSLLRFALRSTKDRFDSLDKIISSSKFLLEFDLKTRSIEIIKPLKLHEDSISALYFDGNDVLYKNYELTDFGILSPATVLTEQREKIVNLSLKDAIEALNNTEIPQDKNTDSAYDSFIRKLSEQDFEHYSKALDSQKRGFIRANDDSSDSYRRYLMLFAGNNYKENFSDSELQSYYRYCSSQIQSQLNQYLFELESLMENTASRSPENVNLIRRIQSYPMEL